MTIADFTIRDKNFRLNLGDRVATDATNEPEPLTWDAAASIDGRSTQSKRQVEMRGWLLASESALAKGWDNPLDAQYDAL